MSSTLTFRSALSQTVLIPEQFTGTKPLQARTSYFTRNTALVLKVVGTDATIKSTLEDWLIIGRGLDNNDHHLDLSRFGAEQLGVSRRHIRLIRGTTTLVIEDLGTRNGTYVNGKKLPIGQHAILSDGDEIRLGKITFVVRFERKNA